jgi:hypothetical protein
MAFIRSFPRLERHSQTYFDILKMHFYRICLILLHITSALCYLPHLITHVTSLSFQSVSLQSKIAFAIYWFNYCLIVTGVLIWCLLIICRKRTTWQVMQVSVFLLIAKLIYTLLDVTTRILLRHQIIVIIFDIIHIIILFPAICISFLLVHHVKTRRIITTKS